MKKRILAAFLCLCMFLSSESLSVIANSQGLTEADTTVETTEETTVQEGTVSITLDGETVGDFLLEVNEEKTLTAQVDGFTAAAWQWQIQADGAWVSILDKTGQNCRVSYALVKSQLDGNGCAWLRCVVTGTDGNVYYSSSVAVTMFEDMGISTVEETGDTEGETQNQTSDEDSTTESSYVTIQVAYTYISGSDVSDAEAYKSYVAKVQTTQDFSTTVVSPAVVGYSPFLEEKDATSETRAASTITLNYTKDGTLTVGWSGQGEDDENLTITKQTDDSYLVTVYYHPAEVSYAVRYYFQNVNDDLYTENASLYWVGTAKTGTEIDDSVLALSQENGKEQYGIGFTKLYHIPARVAADSSTVFECYYDRIYYLIQFDCNGGYGTDPIYARYGTSFLVNDPVRYGYVFKGWADVTESDNDTIVNLPTKIDAWDSTRYYKAVWEEADTTYTVAYWITTAAGNQFIESRTVSAKSNDVVSGSDDLMSNATFCGEEDHTHTAACYTFHDHANCNLAITGTYWGTETLGQDDQTVINVLEGYEISDYGTVTAGEECYVYSIRSYATDYYWLKLKIGDQWYSHGRGSASDVANLVCVKEATISYNSKTWYVEKYYADLSDHGCELSYSKAAQVSCGKHMHTSDCYFSGSYLEYQKADTGVTVAGDGSTVVNVYYTYKDYTLRFYYARYGDYTVTTTTTDDDGNTVEQTMVYEDVYQVVGGSTYKFGASGGWGSEMTGDAATDALIRLDYPGDQWGIVGAEPKLKASYIENADLIKKYGLTSGAVDYDGYTYYYLEFTAPYQSDIADVWPVDVLEPVALSEDHPHNNHGDKCYNYAYFSAWNGQYGVAYSHESHINNNQTVKGVYQILDEHLIFNTSVVPSYADDTTVSYLCFWENGADIGWSVPKYIDYKLYKELVTGVDPTDALLDGDGQVQTSEYNGKTYYLYKDFTVYDNSGYAEQTEVTLTGYTLDGKEAVSMDSVLLSGETNKMDAYGVYFYYGAKTQTSIFFNNYNQKTEVTGITYGTALKNSEEILGTYLNDDGTLITPDYPAALEENAYVFKGWYTTAACLDGSEYDLVNATMPAENLALYAKWELTAHTVKFYASRTDMENGSEPLYEYSEEKENAITHGNVVGSVAQPTNEDESMTFLGWFYLENGEKKAFTPADMRVNKDLNIFADWQSQNSVQYTLHYVLYDEDKEAPAVDESGKIIYVAADTFGYAYIGSTRTFQAKAGGPLAQLYDNNAGYYPLAATHSITMDKDAANNEYTFYYVQRSTIKYTIEYRNVKTSELLEDATIVDDNSDAVVTVRYKAFTGYVPDAFYKRLVLSADESLNIITFYYTPETTSGGSTEDGDTTTTKPTSLYAVRYLFANLDAAATDLAISLNSKGYTLSDSYETSYAKAEDTIIISASDHTYTGFAIQTEAVVVHGYGTETDDIETIDVSDGTFSFELDEEGSVIYLFYKRVSYSYTVNYYQYGTTTSVKAQTTGSAEYGATLAWEDFAKELSGYTLVTDVTDRTLTIGAVEASNIITIYYSPKTYQVYYQPVMYGEVVEGAGWLTINMDTVLGSSYVDGTTTFKSCTASSDQFYTFVGWYTDVSCDGNPYMAATDGKATITPTISEDTYEYHYYALFVPTTSDLTIKIENGVEGQEYVLELLNKQTGLTIDFTITGNGSVTIYDAHWNNYTLTLITDWNWRYEVNTYNFVHNDKDGTEVTLTVNKTNDLWVSGSTMSIYSGGNGNG